MIRSLEVGITVISFRRPCELLVGNFGCRWANHGSGDRAPVRQLPWIMKVVLNVNCTFKVNVLGACSPLFLTFGYC